MSPIRPHHEQSLVTKLARLTDRKFEVLLLLGDGLLDVQVALELHIAVSTVKTHAASLRDKLDVASAFLATVA